ncbi:MAG: SUMF1/EgtB/PvdO family nonheme iron enzyme [Anaerolineae bacterium]
MMRLAFLLPFVMLMVAVSGMAMAQAQNERKAGDTRQDEHGVTQVWVPAGCFLMGSSDEQMAAALESEPPAWAARAKKYEQPQHEVCLTSGYWIDQTEVTNAAFQSFVDDEGYTSQDYWSEKGWAWLQKQDVAKLPAACEGDDVPENPRVCVTWYEAEAYAAWRGGSLPSEAQWEFAARGPESRIYPWGDEWDAALANVVDSEGVVAVGSYPDGASWVGALDMAGNAMEWVQDWLSDVYYRDSPKDDPTGPAKGTKKVEKGGWWGSNPYVARSAYKHFEDPPTYQDHHIGFRVVTAE